MQAAEKTCCAKRNSGLDMKTTAKRLLTVKCASCVTCCSQTVPFAPFLCFSSPAMDSRVFDSLSDQVRIQGTVNTIPRAFSSKLLPHNYVLIPATGGTLMTTQTSSASFSHPSSSSTSIMNLDKEMSFFDDTKASEQLPRCYENPKTLSRVMQPYARPRIFKKYPGKRKPP